MDVISTLVLSIFFIELNRGIAFHQLAELAFFFFFICKQKNEVFIHVGAFCEYKIDIIWNQPQNEEVMI